MLERCRTCLVEIPAFTYVMLNSNDVTSKSIRAELSACVPELQLNLVEDPVICRNCVSILQLAYDFKTRCLLSEKRIQSCIKNTTLNGKRVTLTALFSFSMETNRGSGINGSEAEESNDISSDNAEQKSFRAEPERLRLGVESDNVEQGSTNYYITLTANDDSNVVMNSDVNIVGREEENANVGVNGEAVAELIALEFQENVLKSSSVATYINKVEISQNLHNTIDYDIVKEEKELLTFKTESESVNDEEERSNDGDVNEETRSIAYDTDRNNTVYVEYEFSVPRTIDDQNVKENNPTNLHNQNKEHYVSVQRVTTDSNYSCESYSGCTATGDASANPNITEHKIPSFKNEEERTNSYKTDLCKFNKAFTVNRDTISQEINDTNEDIIIKEEYELETFKTDKINDCTINVDVPIKQCRVTLERLRIPLNVLRNTNEKPKCVREKSRNFDKRDQTPPRKKSFCCNVCEYSTTTKGSLNSHMRVHTVDKPFRCNICDFSTNRKESLIIHMRSHTGEKPLRCNICEFRTAYRTNLTIHLRNHTGEKCYPCSDCEYVAVRKDYLVSHKRIHTGEKPFVCKICDFSGARKHTVAVHMRIHTGEKPYRCNICDRSMSRKGDLTRHMRKHTGEKPFQCNVCGFMTSRKGNLITHIQTHS